MPDEMTDDHRIRAMYLLREADMMPTHRGYTPGEILAAYQAVLTKDLLFTMNELLIYKQQEVHK